MLSADDFYFHFNAKMIKVSSPAPRLPFMEKGPAGLHHDDSQKSDAQNEKTFQRGKTNVNRDIRMEGNIVKTKVFKSSSDRKSNLRFKGKGSRRLCSWLVA